MAHDLDNQFSKRRVDDGLDRPIYVTNEKFIIDPH